MIDKVTVIRTFGLSKLWYLLNFITLEEQDIKNLERLTFNYIWSNKVETVTVIPYLNIHVYSLRFL
jgi:hypothetical protein